MPIVNENIVSQSVKSGYIVSAIVSTFNSMDFIEGKIIDLINQSLGENLEIIIINSNSAQNEDEIIRRYIQTNSNITYIITDQTETIYAAWNRGIKHSKGKYITNSNTDDRLAANALEILSGELEHNNKLAVVYADQYISNVPNKKYDEICKSPTFNRRTFSHIRLLNDYNLGSQSLWRANLHSDEGIWFDEEYEIAGDYDFICRVAEKHNIAYVNKVLGVYYRSSEDKNKEFQNSKKTLKESLRIKIKYINRFIDALTENESKRLIFKLRLACSVPIVFYKIYNYTMQRMAPYMLIPEKYFYIYLYSAVKVKNNQTENAKRILNRYGSSEHPLVKYQYQRLVDNEK